MSQIVAPLLAGLLRDGRAVSVPVTGHSMAPFLRAGDIVTITPRPHRRPSLGDVVLFSAGPGRVLLHRIVGRAGDRLFARGDAAPALDPSFGREELLGFVTHVERQGRRRRLGLGPERYTIAWLSRLGVLRGLASLRAWLRRTPRSAGS